jgi:hypothetical protein
MSIFMVRTARCYKGEAIRFEAADNVPAIGQKRLGHASPHNQMRGEVNTPMVGT